MLFGAHETVSHENNHAAELQEFYESHENFDDPAVRRDYFGRMDEDAFVDFTQQVTSVIRTGDSTERQEYDGEHVALAGHAVPDQRDKTELIKDTWRTAREFLHDPKLDDHQALEYAGLTAAGGILFAHPNIDGNGRMARAVDHMMEEGTEQPLEDVLPRILGENGNTDWYVAPDAQAMRAYVPEPPQEVNGYTFPDKVDWQQDGLIEDPYARNSDPVELLADSSLGNYSIHTFITHADAQAVETIQKYTVEQQKEDGSTIRVLQAKDALNELANLEDKGIGYAAQLLEADREVRKEYVRDFLRMMQEREQKELPARVQRGMNSERGFSVDKATKEHFGRLAVGTQIVPADHMRAFHNTYSRIKRERDGFE